MQTQKCGSLEEDAAANFSFSFFFFTVSEFLNYSPLHLHRRNGSVKRKDFGSKSASTFDYHYDMTLKQKVQKILLLYLPLSSSKTSIPKDQQSAELSWPLFRMISGATYSGVPQNVHVFLPRPTFLAKPKSTCGTETHSKTKRPHCEIFDPHYLTFLEKTRPHQLGISSAVQYDVLGFEVSVDDSSGVQESQSLDDTASVKPSGAVIK